MENFKFSEYFLKVKRRENLRWKSEVFFLYSKAENSRINNFVFLTVDVVLWSNIIEAGNWPDSKCSSQVRLTVIIS